MAQLHHPDEMTTQLKVMMSLILFSIIIRITAPPFLGHYVNFSPIDAIALFCGAYFNKRCVGIVAILLSVWLSDLLISKMTIGKWVLFYQGWYWQYTCYILIIGIGSIITNKVKFFGLLLASTSSAILFFIVSNFGVWYSSFLYPATSNGLLACYMTALPFFKNTILSDMFFSILLFTSVRVCLQDSKSIRIKSRIWHLTQNQLR